MSASFALLPFAFAAAAACAPSELPCEPDASFPDLCWALPGFFPFEACFDSVTVFLGERSGFLDATATSLFTNRGAPAPGLGFVSTANSHARHHRSSERARDPTGPL